MSDRYILEEYGIENSPEPENYKDIEKKYDCGVEMSSLGAYDIIGVVLTENTIEDYVRNHPFSRNVYMTVVHNSATPMSAYAGINTVKGFYNYHVHNRGWKSIGYHWVIGPDGKIFGARKMEWMGSHAGSNGNPGSVGVCLVGNFETSDKPTEKAKKSLIALHNALDKYRYGNKGISGVRVHYEFMSTACPGITKAEIQGWFTEPKERPFIYLNGEKIGEGFIVEGRAYVPVRIIAEGCGLNVNWNAAEYKVELTKEVISSDAVTILDKNPEVYLDGKKIGEGFIVNGITYVPVRIVAESCGLKVQWNAAEYKVDLKK